MKNKIKLITGMLCVIFILGSVNANAKNKHHKRKNFNYYNGCAPYIAPGVVINSNCQPLVPVRRIRRQYRNNFNNNANCHNHNGNNQASCNQNGCNQNGNNNNGYYYNNNGNSNGCGNQNGNYYGRRKHHR